MYVKTLSLVAAVAISVLSLRAFAEPAQSQAPEQVAMVAGNLLAKSDRQLIAKSPLHWPKFESVDQEQKVVVRYTIEADGTVDHVEPVFQPRNPAFAAAATAAVRGWVYAPAATATENVEAIAYFHAATE
jgi:outer membrane biosynthesis protein TonB